MNDLILFYFSREREIGKERERESERQRETERERERNREENLIWNDIGQNNETVRKRNKIERYEKCGRIWKKLN